MGFISKIVKMLLYSYRCDSEHYIAHLKKIGCKIGGGTCVFEPNTTIIDETRPWLIDIGDNVQITSGVTILTHGYDWAVLKGAYGNILGSAGLVKIEDNVFIGMQSTILKGVHIGNNVIIGANSLVNKDIPDNVVAAGNPCKVIMPLDDYYEKRKSAQIEETADLVRLYRERYGKEPSKEVLNEFFWLFCDGKDDLPKCWENMMHLVGNYEKSREIFDTNKKSYRDMQEFLRSVN